MFQSPLFSTKVLPSHHPQPVPHLIQRMNHHSPKTIQPSQFHLDCQIVLEDIPEVRNRLKTAIASSDNTIETRFFQAIQANQLPRDFPARSRACLATSLMHGIALRARAMEQKASLITFAADASELVLRI